jgi:hypothetical protein
MVGAVMYIEGHLTHIFSVGSVLGFRQRAVLNPQSRLAHKFLSETKEFPWNT